MADKPIPTPDELRQLLTYDPETGLLHWKHREPCWFRDTNGRTKEHACANWNSRYAGTPAFTYQTWSGHLAGKISEKHLAAHRVAWAIFHGKWPEHEVDHINGDPSDNRISNLRDVRRDQNGKNLPINPTNTSGETGVNWHRQAKRWRAYIGSGGTRIHLGLFRTFEEAVEARSVAEDHLGYHPNHGKREAHGMRLRRSNA